jgi:hypothetical protein
MTDIFRLARKIERCLGVPLIFTGAPADRAFSAHIDDSEQSRCKFTKVLWPPSAHVANLKALHEDVYKQRGRRKFEIQNGHCALCGEKMKGTENTEIDHIATRGAHGRNDDISNLRVVHAEPYHRERHNNPQRRTA